MKVTKRLHCPVRQGDDSWDIVIREIEEDVPDKGRHHIICDKCPNDNYPECRKTCHIEKNIISKNKMEANDGVTLSNERAYKEGKQK